MHLFSVRVPRAEADDAKGSQAAVADALYRLRGSFAQALSHPTSRRAKREDRIIRRGNASG